jgi:hypothetical protein
MRFSLTFFTALALVVPAFLAAPSPLIEVEKSAGEVIPGSYIVTLKSTVNKDAHLAWLKPHLATDSANDASASRVTHRYDAKGFIHAYAGKFSPETLAILRGSADVKAIEEVHRMTACLVCPASHAPLSRIQS